MKFGNSITLVYKKEAAEYGNLPALDSYQQVSHYARLYDDLFAIHRTGNDHPKGRTVDVDNNGDNNLNNNDADDDEDNNGDNDNDNDNNDGGDGDNNVNNNDGDNDNNNNNNGNDDDDDDDDDSNNGDTAPTILVEGESPTLDVGRCYNVL